MFVDLLPMKIRRIVKIFVCVMIETFCVLMIYASYGLVVLQMSSNQLSPAMRVPMYFGTLAIPIGFALIFVRVIQVAKKEVFG
jgi:TRAP-type C4-dicarboxylate transport system permease small subunit